MTDFLGVVDVLDLQVDRYGGRHGVRDLGLLESAVAQPQAIFGGKYLHSDIFEMAAAYLFHIVQNHPFLDGNKRAGGSGIGLSRSQQCRDQRAEGQHLRSDDVRGERPGR